MSDDHDAEVTARCTEIDRLTAIETAARMAVAANDEHNDSLTRGAAAFGPSWVRAREAWDGLRALLGRATATAVAIAYDCDGCQTVTVPFTNGPTEMRKVKLCPNCPTPSPPHE